jgi:hypothetical protein
MIGYVLGHRTSHMEWNRVTRCTRLGYITTHDVIVGMVGSFETALHALKSALGQLVISSYYQR